MDYQDEKFFTPENYVKLYENKDWMKDKWIKENWRVKDIANALHISSKLVIIWLNRHGIY
jgi:hypothetical protein